ncbi:MAG: penicillin-binding transpeptidase domain-containing protein [Dethiobacteria bacterium]
MKLISARTAVLVALTVLLVLGLTVFLVQYVNHAAAWAQHPSNRHFYTNARLNTSGTIYDRHGNILIQMVDGEIRFNEDATVRTAVMHTTGDRGDNVETGALLVFRDRLTGWNFFNGAYRFNNKISPVHDLTLTLDANLCAKAYQELNGRKGTVGIYNYKTGEILCMVSSPSFDPANPPDLQSYPESYEGVYLNRLLSATYTPGSVFKLVTTAAALDHLPYIMRKPYQCQGRTQIEGNMVTCLTAHGQVTLKEALAHSCNVTFAQIALELGADRLQEYAELAGFNSSLEIDGIKTAVGKVDLARATKAELAWAGIGQFTNTANPLNFMAFVGAIANDGIRVTPKILADKNVFSSLNDTENKKELLSKETTATLKNMMRNNTLTVYGEHNFRGLELCAKSGTAEVGAERKPHAWFTGFLARDDFPLAFVVVIEGGGAGSRAAASVAAKVLPVAIGVN